MAAGNHQRLPARTIVDGGGHTAFFARMYVSCRTSLYILSIIAASILVMLVATGMIYPSFLMPVLLGTCIPGCLFALLDVVSQVALWLKDFYRPQPDRPSVRPDQATVEALEIILNVGFVVTLLLIGMPLFPAFMYFRMSLRALSLLSFFASAGIVLAERIRYENLDRQTLSFLLISVLIFLVGRAMCEYSIFTWLQSGSEVALSLCVLGMLTLVHECYLKGVAEMRQLNSFLRENVSEEELAGLSICRVLMYARLSSSHIQLNGVGQENITARASAYLAGQSQWRFPAPFYRRETSRNDKVYEALQSFKVLSDCQLRHKITGDRVLSEFLAEELQSMVTLSPCKTPVTSSASGAEEQHNDHDALLSYLSIQRSQGRLKNMLNVPLDRDVVFMPGYRLPVVKKYFQVLVAYANAEVGAQIRLEGHGFVTVTEQGKQSVSGLLKSYRQMYGTKTGKSWSAEDYSGAYRELQLKHAWYENPPSENPEPSAYNESPNLGS